MDHDDSVKALTVISHKLCNIEYKVFDYSKPKTKSQFSNKCLLSPTPHCHFSTEGR